MIRSGTISGLIPLRRTRRIVLGVLLALVSLAAARAEAPDNFTTSDPGPGTVSITGQWRFSTGDNSAWASPSFNDSSWELIRGNDTWGSQTHPGYTGYAWYRRSVDITNAAGPIAIEMPPVDDVYEIYFNGQKIGAYGKMPPHAWWWAPGHPEVFTLPATRGVLAIRVWKCILSSVDPSTLGGLNSEPVLGRPQLLAGLVEAGPFKIEHNSLPRLLTSSVLLVSGLIALILFFRQRSEWLLLWLAIFLLADSLNGFINILLPLRYGLTFSAQQLIIQVQNSMQDISLWLMLLNLFGLIALPRWRRWTIILASLYLAAQLVDVVTILYWDNGGLFLQWLDAVSTVIYSLTPLYLFAIILAGLIRGARRSLWPLAFAVSVFGVFTVVTALAGQGTRFTHWTLATTLTTMHVTFAGYQFGLRFILDTVLFLALLFTVAHHHFLDRRRRAQVEMELKSAGEVQQVLMPDASPIIPGFTIGNSYRPASEVGGDFFQVIALPDNAALVIIGDVSGKGLTAAMSVSLIVGALRTLAEFTTSPAEVLRHLNRRLYGRLHDGFATCLVLHLAADGTATLANAGHLPPVSSRRDLSVEGSLPLGIVESPDYADVSLKLRDDETLTLYTDGVIEARNAQGDLFGFDRVQQMLRSGASLDLVVSEACAFGQQDDITVLSIRRDAHQSMTSPHPAAQTAAATA